MIKVVKDIMTSNVINVHVSTTLQELVELFIEKKLSGVPVINDDGNLVGIISKTDLVTHGLEKELSELLSNNTARTSNMDLPSFDNLLGANPVHEVVEDIMSTPVITARPDTDISELVKTMLDSKIHRIIITENDKIKGIVTTMDLLRLIDERLG